MLRAIGTSRRQVKRIVRLEAVITSLTTLVLLVAAAALAGIVASLWPARRAARLDVLRALAYE